LSITRTYTLLGGVVICAALDETLAGDTPRRSDSYMYARAAMALALLAAAIEAIS
jgi:hypothetical protein